VADDVSQPVRRSWPGCRRRGVTEDRHFGGAAPAADLQAEGFEQPPGDVVGQFCQVDGADRELVQQFGVRLAGPEPVFLRARIAERRDDTSQAAALVTKCLKEMPGRQEYLDFAVEVGAELPPRAREIAPERPRAADAHG
jgi:hypothetical protein